MTRPELESEVLSLDPRDKARLTHLLVVSLEGLAPEQVTELWVEEAERRDSELESGSVTGIPGPEVFARIRSRRA